MKTSRLGLALAAAVAVAGCGGDREASAQTGMAAVLDEVASGPRDGAFDAPLQEGQEVQGVIAAQVEGRDVAFRSVLTRVSDDIGEKIGEAMASDKGRDAVANANERAQGAGLGVQVTGEDVARIVGGMAGKVFADAEVRASFGLPLLMMQLQGTAPDGRRLMLSLNFNRESLQFQDGSISYQPSADTFAGAYVGDVDEGQLDMEIEQFARNDDGSFLVRGRFQARDLVPGRIARTLSGQVDSLTGRFAYDSIPFRE